MFTQMFNRNEEALYKFRYRGITYYVVEDDPRNDYVRVRNTYGTSYFQKDDLQHILENQEADIGCDDKLLGLKDEDLNCEA